MEENYISERIETCFYIDNVNKKYGACINVKDLDRAEEIKQRFKEQKKEQIKAWQQMWEGGTTNETNF